MKYLRPKDKGAKIKISPSQTITVPMNNIVRVDNNTVAVMATTGAKMKYQNKDEILCKRKYIVEMLSDERHFYITDDYKFTELK